MIVTKCDRCGKTWRFSESCETRHNGHFLITWARGLGKKGIFAWIVWTILKNS